MISTITLFPLQTLITELVDPTFFSVETVLLLGIILCAILWIGVKLRSAAILFFWSLSLSCLILTILIDLSLLWFWGIILLTIMIVPLSALYRFLL